MSVAYAIITLTYAEEDLQPEDETFYLTITQGFNETADVRGKDVLVPGMVGQVSRPRKKDTRRIVLTGHVMGQGTVDFDTEEYRANYRTTVRFLQELFDPARDPADLVAIGEAGSTYTIAARPLPGFIIAEDVESEFGRVSVELLSVDPDWVVT